MKDLVNIAKNVIKFANPKKEALVTSHSELKSKFNEIKIESKNEQIKATKEAILNAANKRLENFEHKQAKEDINYRDLSVEITHAKYNASLLELDAKTMQYTVKKNINLSDAVNQSREYKKRLKAFLTACAHRDASKLDKALAALQQALKAQQRDAITVEEVQRIMQHSTATQANYFKKFAHEIGVVTASRSNQLPMTINKENEVYKDFVSL